MLAVGDNSPQHGHIRSDAGGSCRSSFSGSEGRGVRRPDAPRCSRFFPVPSFFCFSLLLPKAAFEAWPGSRAAWQGRPPVLRNGRNSLIVSPCHRLALQGGDLPVPCRRLLQVLPQPKDVLAQRHHRRAPRRLNTSLLEKRFQARYLDLKNRLCCASRRHLLVRRRKLAPGRSRFHFSIPAWERAEVSAQVNSLTRACNASARTRCCSYSDCQSGASQDTTGDGRPNPSPPSVRGCAAPGVWS